MSRHTRLEMTELLKKRDHSKLAVFKEYCKLMADIPLDLAEKDNMTEDKMKEVFAPIANALYEFIRDNGYGADALDIGMIQQLAEMNTLQRVSNVIEELMRGAFFQKMGYEYPTKDMSVAQIEELGKIVVDK